jgi:predicted permease
LEFFLIVLNSLFPIFTLLLLGFALKRQGMTDTVFLKTADKLIYYIFFPIMLFWKIGGASLAGGIDWSFCVASLCTLLTMFVLSTLVISLAGITDFKAGSFSQGCYRFNTYIGVAVILNSLGEEGIQYFGVVIGFAIPLINVFAVSTLIWFSGQEMDLQKRLRFAGRALVSNPLIIGCIAGILYARLIGGFPVFVDNSLSLVSMVALPLALISVGGSLSFAGVRENVKIAFLASILKIAVLPLIGFFYFFLFDVTGVPFKVGLLFFSLPASTAIYVLSSQLNSDTELASSVILVSTFLSFISLSVALLL